MITYWARGLEGKKRLLARQKVTPRQTSWFAALGRMLFGLVAFWRWGRRGLDEGQRFR